MWACSPTSSTESSAAQPLDGLAGGARAEAEAELGVVLAGAHVLVGVGLDPGGDPHQDLRRALGRRGQALQAVDLVEGVDDDAADTDVQGPLQLGVGLVVAVQHQPLGGHAGDEGDVELAAGGHVEVHPLLVGQAPPWPCTGRPWSRRRRRRRRRRPPPGSGPAGGPRRRRRPACRTRRPGPAGRSPRPTGGRRRPRWRCRAAVPAGAGSHLVGGVGPEQVQPDGQAHPYGLDQPQPGLGQGRLDAVGHHVAVVVEAVEAPGQLPDPGGDLVGRPGDGGPGDDLGQLRQRSQQLQLPLVGEQARGRRRPAAPARCPARPPSARWTGSGRGRTGRRRPGSPSPGWRRRPGRRSAGCPSTAGGT